MALTTTIAESISFEKETTENKTGTDISFNASASIELLGNLLFYTKKIVQLSGADQGTVLYTCSSDGAGADFDYNLVKYARITNISSDLMYLQVKCRTGTPHYLRFMVAPGGSFIINRHDEFLANIATLSEMVVLEVRAEGADSTVSAEVFIAHEQAPLV